jgi:hypothetical protein
MSTPETAEFKSEAAKISPRYMQRRAGDDKAVSQHRRQFWSVDALASTGGVSSRHYQRRASDDKATAEAVAATVLAAKPPPPASSVGRELLARVDQTTPELRRRIVEAVNAESPKRRFRSMTWPLVAGLSIRLWPGPRAIQKKP